MSVTLQNLRPLALISTLTAFALISACGDSTPSSTTGDEAIELVAPADVEALTLSSTSVQLSWSDVEDEVSYAVDYATDSDFTEKRTLMVLADVLELTIAALEPSTEYFFRVYAQYHEGDSPFSDVVSATTDAPPLQAPNGPSDIAVILTAATDLTVSWTDNSDNEEGFTVAYSTTNDFAYSSLISVQADAVENLIAALDEEATYYFRVRAHNSAGESDWTIAIPVTTLARPWGSLELDGGARGTNANEISIDSTMQNVDEMRRSADDGATWTAWEAYADTKSFNVALVPEGKLTLVVEYRNAVGEVLSRTDSLILDRTAPVVNKFVINGDDWATATRAIELNNDVDGASVMRFVGDHTISWPTIWEDFSPTRSWNLADFTGSREIFAQFEDEYGNHSEASAIIVYLPSDQALSINAGVAFTTSGAVSLDITSGSAVEMRFSNDETIWSDWETFNATKAWDLSTGEGEKTVYVELKDAATNITPVSDGIVLDSVVPQIAALAINGGDTSAYSREVSLHLEVLGDPAYVSFAYNGGEWSPWRSYQEYYSLVLFAPGAEDANEDVLQTIEVRVRDYAGNTSSDSDQILFDEITLLQLTLVKFVVADDGDRYGTGEWSTYASTAANYSPSFVQFYSENFGSADHGETYILDERVNLTMINGAGYYWVFKWFFGEEDDGIKSIGKVYETYTYPYEVGSFVETLTGEGKAFVYWEIERLD